jgi:hypothetical protein
MLLSGLVSAQISVRSSLPEKSFLLFDNIPLRLEITNSSGEAIVLSEEDAENHVMLRVRNVDNQVIPRTDLPILKEPWVIPNGVTSAREFDLVRLFRIRRARSFRGLQHVVVDGDVYEGPTLIFDVREGIKVDEIVRKKEDRIFTLMGMTQGGGDVLLLRVTNRDRTMTLGTFFLERHLRFYPPFMKVNAEGEIGILHYVGPSQAVLSTFSPDGSQGKREYYQVSPGVPIRLHAGESSSFIVEGATKASTEGSP